MRSSVDGLFNTKCEKLLHQVLIWDVNRIFSAGSKSQPQPIIAGSLIQGWLCHGAVSPSHSIQYIVTTERWRCDWLALTERQLRLCNLTSEMAFQLYEPVDARPLSDRGNLRMVVTV